MMKVEGAARGDAGAQRAAVADLDGDGRVELMLALEDEIQIRASRDLEQVVDRLPLKNVQWLTASDVDGDGEPDLIASRYSEGGSVSV